MPAVGGRSSPGFLSVGPLATGFSFFASTISTSAAGGAPPYGTLLALAASKIGRSFCYSAGFLLLIAEMKASAPVKPIIREIISSADFLIGEALSIKHSIRGLIQA